MSLYNDRISIVNCNAPIHQFFFDVRVSRLICIVPVAALDILPLQLNYRAVVIRMDI